KGLIPYPGNQGLRGSDRFAPAGQALLDIFVDGSVEVRLTHNRVDKSDLVRAHRGKARSGEKQLSSCGTSDLLEHERRDPRRKNAQLDLGEAEHRAVLCHNDVADRGQASTAP